MLDSRMPDSTWIRSCVTSFLYLAWAVAGLPSSSSSISSIFLPPAW